VTLEGFAGGVFPAAASGLVELVTPGPEGRVRVSAYSHTGPVAAGSPGTWGTNGELVIGNAVEAFGG
jgi:hypothetical protein